ncbi:MAG: PCRF domain-containing protein [Candidatus Staskawiczbacteria bacterium]|nr:PCRF domain-containing protein [Candidatus Staskawiczbacteria bacterium]
MNEEINSKQSVIIEIRAGAGGDEAGLFARDLYRMYSRYGQVRGWKERVLDSSASSIGGYKEIIFELTGEFVFDEMQNEGGVHRVKPKKTEINISPADLEFSTYKASGPGGQYVNKTESAVRIVHKPTGIVVTCQSERNQFSNRETAMAILSAKILQKQEEADLSKLTSERREQIASAKRAEKIRTYNYPQSRITDHRINKSWHDLERIVDGNLGPVIKSFRKIKSEK